MASRLDLIGSKFPEFWVVRWSPRLDPGSVPYDIRSLVPLAEALGVNDEKTRDSLVEAMPRELKEIVVEVLLGLEDPLDEWLSGEESFSENPSDEYVAFSALRMLVDSF